MGWGKWGTLVFLAGCQVFDPSLVDDAPPVQDSGVQTDSGGGIDASLVGLRRVPPRPEGENSGDQSLVLALRDVALRQDGDRWRTIGLDLDGLDTQLPIPEVECVPPNDESEPLLDGEEGIDNAFGDRFFNTVNLARPDLERNAQKNQERGLGTILLRIFDWNGERDDPQVDVWVSQAAAGTSADPEEVEFDGFDLVMRSDGSPAPPPEWDGNDHWFGRSESFVAENPENPQVRDDNAYITEGRLVVRLPDRIDILFFAGADQGVRVRLTDAWAMGTFDEDFDQVETATVAGRWAINDLLETGENAGICVGTPERRIVDSQLNNLADVRSTPGTGGEGVRCDALSLGVTFSGRRGNWAGLGPSLPLPNPCEEH